MTPPPGFSRPSLTRCRAECRYGEFGGTSDRADGKSGSNGVDCFADDHRMNYLHAFANASLGQSSLIGYPVNGAMIDHTITCTESGDQQLPLPQWAFRYRAVHGAEFQGVLPSERYREKLLACGPDAA